MQMKASPIFQTLKIIVFTADFNKAETMPSKIGIVFHSIIFKRIWPSVECTQELIPWQCHIKDGCILPFVRFEAVWYMDRASQIYEAQFKPFFAVAVHVQVYVLRSSLKIQRDSDCRRWCMAFHYNFVGKDSFGGSGILTFLLLNLAIQQMLQIQKNSKKKSLREWRKSHIFAMRRRQTIIQILYIQTTFLCLLWIIKEYNDDDEDEDDDDDEDDDEDEDEDDQYSKTFTNTEDESGFTPLQNDILT